MAHAAQLIRCFNSSKASLADIKKSLIEACHLFKQNSTLKSKDLSSQTSQLSSRWFSTKSISIPSSWTNRISLWSYVNENSRRFSTFHLEIQSPRSAMIGQALKEDRTMTEKIYELGDSGKWEEAVKLVGTSVRPQAQSINAALIACLSCNQPEAAIKVFEKFVNDIQFSRKLWTTAIRAYVWVQKWKRGMVLYEEMKNHDACDTVLFNTITARYFEGEQWNCVLKFYKDWTARRLSPHKVSYSRALQAAFKLEDWDQVQLIFTDLKKKGYVDTRAYDRILHACVKQRQWKECIKYFEEMKSEGLKPSQLSYSKCIQAARREGDSIKMEALYVEMQNQGYFPNNAIYKNLISGYQESQEYNKMFEIFSKMKERPDQQLDLGVYENLFRYCGKEYDYMKALELLVEVKEAGLEPTERMYQDSVSACEYHGQINISLGLQVEMKRANISPSIGLYNQMLKSCGKSGRYERVTELVSKMTRHGIRPNGHTYTLLLLNAWKKSTWRRCVSIWEEMISVGVKPELSTYRVMLSICKSYKLDKHVRMLEEEMHNFMKGRTSK